MAAKTAEDGTDPKSEGQTVPKIREPDRRLFLAKNPRVAPPNCSIACEMNGFELGREHNPEHIVSWFFKEIEGQIDAIEMACRTQEWEHEGMIYFLELCGRKIHPRTSPYEDSCPEPSQESETSKKDASPDPDLQLNNTDPITLTEPEQNDNISATTLTDDSEEGASMFFEIFESLAESFFAQIDDTRSSHDLDAVIGALWERALLHKFCETDLAVLDSHTVEDQCLMIAEFFQNWTKR